jgi:hypothetical protein
MRFPTWMEFSVFPAHPAVRGVRLRGPLVGRAHGKIDGSYLPGPGGVSSLRPDHLTNDRTSRERDSPKRNHIRGARPWRAEKSRVWLRLAPVACGLALIRCKGKANPA